MTPSDAPVLDSGTLEQLLALDDGGLGLFLEMFDLFKEDTPTRIRALAPLAESGALEDLADAAHAIKGAASTMGAMRLRAAAAAIEGSCRTETVEVGALPGMVRRVEDEFQGAVEAMEAFRTSRQ